MSERTIRYLIVDDEPIAHRIIVDYCTAVPHLTLVKHCYNALEAMQYLSSNNVDLMFLDLNMPKIKGFDFLKTLTKKPKVIVTTAYKEYALQGYELDISDYLLKPFSFERFLKAVNKATEISTPKTVLRDNNVQNNTLEKRVFIKGDRVQHQILLSDVNYIEACGNYCLVFLQDKKIITHQKISQFEIDLSGDDFIRIHKSYIVAKNKIDAIASAKLTVANKELPIGQTFREKISSLMKV